MGQQLISLQEEANPFRRLAEDQGTAFPGENLFAQRLALQHRSENLCQEHAIRIHVLQHVELREGTIPLTKHTKQLEEQDARSRFGWRLPHTVLRANQRLVKLTSFDAFFGVHVESLDTACALRGRAN